MNTSVNTARKIILKVSPKTEIAQGKTGGCVYKKKDNLSQNQKVKMNYKQSDPVKVSAPIVGEPYVTTQQNCNWIKCATVARGFMSCAATYDDRFDSCGKNFIRKTGKISEVTHPPPNGASQPPCWEIWPKSTF